MIQSNKHTAKKPLHFTNPPNSKLHYVACVDGVFLATKREIVEQFKFDAATLKASIAMTIFLPGYRVKI